MTFLILLQKVDGTIHLSILHQVQALLVLLALSLEAQILLKLVVEKHLFLFVEPTLHFLVEALLGNQPSQLVMLLRLIVTVHTLLSDLHPHLIFVRLVSSHPLGLKPRSFVHLILGHLVQLCLDLVICQLFIHLAFPGVTLHFHLSLVIQELPHLSRS